MIANSVTIMNSGTVTNEGNSGAESDVDQGIGSLRSGLELEFIVVRNCLLLIWREINV